MIFKSLRTLHSAQCGYSCSCYVNRTERERVEEREREYKLQIYRFFFYAGMSVWRSNECAHRTCVYASVCVCESREANEAK